MSNSIVDTQQRLLEQVEARASSREHVGQQHQQYQQYQQQVQQAGVGVGGGGGQVSRPPASQPNSNSALVGYACCFVRRAFACPLGEQSDMDTILDARQSRRLPTPSL